MKKLLIAGAASLALSALPIAASFAVDPPAVYDELTVTIGEACTFTRTSGTGSYSNTMTLGSLNENFGSSTYRAVCNNASGFVVNAAFDELNGPGENITYSATDPEAGSGTWTASLQGGNIAATNGTLMSTDGVTGTEGISATVTYKVSVRSNQAKGNYTGRATYTLNQNS